MQMEVYRGGEDTQLLLDVIDKYAHDKVLEIGTGSGVIAKEAAKFARIVIATDISKEAIEVARQNTPSNVIFIESDLFSFFKQQKIKEKFDLIIFNPPYLPEDERESEKIKAITTGGKHGWEIIERFLYDVAQFLKNDGKILLVFSSLTNKERVDGLIEEHLLSKKIVKEQKIEFFETLYLYEIAKKPILAEINDKEIFSVKKFAKGNRGLVFTGEKEGKLAIKIKNPSSLAEGKIENEARWLKLLNKKGIGPEIVAIGNGWFAMEFVDGEIIEKFIENNNKTLIKDVLKNIFEQMYFLDMMRVDKEEMHHPYKHVIIRESMPILIDFERMHVSQDPKNVTQFAQCIMSRNMKGLLELKNFKIDKRKVIAAARQYKKEMNEKNFKEILRTCQL
ncbi:MAG: methyltransferase [Candidatus Woesearchaeota archaeon]